MMGPVGEEEVDESLPRPVAAMGAGIYEID